MPQILRGFGIRHAALWRGVPGQVREHAFAWSAPDGTAVRCEYLFDGYGSGLPMFAVPGQLAELSARYRRDTRDWFGEDPVLAAKVRYYADREFARRAAPRPASLA